MGFFAGLVGAIASAPVLATGAVTKATGQALSAGAGDIPALRVTGEIIEGMGEYGMAAAGKMSDGIGNFEFSGVDLAALGRGMSGMGFTSLTPGSRENSVALARAPEIEAPAVAPAVIAAPVLPAGIVDVSREELTQLAAPSFSVASNAVSAPAVGGGR